MKFSKRILDIEESGTVKLTPIIKELEKQGRVDEAIVLYEANLKDKSVAGHPYERLRIIYSRQKDYANAIRACQAFVELDSLGLLNEANRGHRRIRQQAGGGHDRDDVRRPWCGSGRQPDRHLAPYRSLRCPGRVGASSDDQPRAGRDHR